ncbi:MULTISPECIES: type I-D CRISPR-associated helicase Cas3' [unclassified Nodularia (in: cyanobacteria)]|uniref:type I-D CRISPR-associated helicase Cas3' n=1 Tax=unclassified Nodularia (in: cyanobacteria) TaxID=2656917 RepID=UPI0018800CA6|nr:MULTISPECIES: type I-D CRISPR-associated helicase Cas3' [unclassified Nodularia (in: cyanobacteria)]MBE9198017.1 type I-D CRISPR-associated helicase Cas3' [Nodularia sp. LEGE 06071]MCC2691677.1 type I-D CRISPR-associated helicase Cas3' [Nodularia sp. LEGE 04288]
MSEEYKITLKPVYSQTVPTPDGVKLPENWSLSWHQLATLEALRDPNIEVVFNTAMTGDGKSLAAYLEVLQGEFSAIGLYPTNELARDQETQIRGYIEQFQPEDEPRVVRLSGADLENYAENEGLKKGAAISTLTSQREVLLTNPDIFHYLHRGAYIIHGDSPDKLWGRIDKDFDLFIFDEFHVFSAPQIASVINTMLLIRCTNRRKKFLFLSATPDPNLIVRLEQAGFRCQVINPIAQNKYQFPETEEQGQQLQTQGWRQVARTISLNFIPLEPAFKASETWLKENSDLILAQFQNFPGSKGAIILNSIAAVKRLTVFFQEIFNPYKLTVGENTGLSGKAIKEQSLMADLVIGTSTIDVGVDFKINFLIFESSDAGNFIQRLGRLGRHEGYEKNGEIIKFENFTAFALVPNFLVERLFQVDSPPLEVNSIYERPCFHNTISENYRQINDFRGYYRRWGAVQSFWLYYQLSDRTIKQQYAQSREQFQKACEEVFGSKLKSIAGRVSGWAKDWKALSGKPGNPIADDAASFRGSSPLQCGLYDLTEENEADRFKTYDLPGILGNLEIEMWTEAGFVRTLKETAQRTRQPIAKGRFAHCLAFMKLRSYREERLNWKFTYPGDLQPIADAWKVQVLTGVEIWQPDNQWIGAINKRLKKEGLVCYVIRRPVSEVRMRLRLPMHFQIYPISDQYSFHDVSAPYAIAFGHSALLLDTLAYTFKSAGDEIWVV